MHSQYNEDGFIVGNLKIPRRGYFVDVGAAGPIGSNTWHFEKRMGWNGLCIDADPRQTLDKRKNTEHCAIKSYDGTVKFFQHKTDPAWSSTSDHVTECDIIEVNCYRLETLLTKHNVKKIHLLSIDVEGTEIEVWESMDWQAHKPYIVIIEYNTYGLESNAQNLLDYFQKLPYKLVHKTSGNFIFLLRGGILVW